MEKRRPNSGWVGSVTSISARSSSVRGHGLLREGYEHVCSFDTIPQRRLMKAVKKRVADRDLRALLWKFLRAGVLEHGHRRDTLTGTPQGGIVSPLAAN